MHSRDSGELSSEVWDHEFKLAFDAWSEVTPLTFSKSDNIRSSDIVIAVGGRKKEGFGRSGGTLAWAQLPPSKDYNGQLLTKFDKNHKGVKVVVDEFGGFVGIIGAEAVLSVLAGWWKNKS